MILSIARTSVSPSVAGRFVLEVRWPIPDASFSFEQVVRHVGSASLPARVSFSSAHLLVDCSLQSTNNNLLTESVTAAIFLC